MKQNEYLANVFEAVSTDSAETLKALHCEDGRVLGIVPWRGTALLYENADAMQKSLPPKFKHRVLDSTEYTTNIWATTLKDNAEKLLNVESRQEQSVCINRQALLDILNACEQDVVQLECMPNAFISADTPVALSPTRETLALVQKHMHSRRGIKYAQDALCITDGARAATTMHDTIIQLGAVRVEFPVMPLRIAFAQTPLTKNEKKTKAKNVKEKLKQKKGSAVLDAIETNTKQTSLRDRLKHYKQKE